MGLEQQSDWSLTKQILNQFGGFKTTYSAWHLLLITENRRSSQHNMFVVWTLSKYMTISIETTCRGSCKQWECLTALDYTNLYMHWSWENLLPTVTNWYWACWDAYIFLIIDHMWHNYKLGYVMEMFNLI